MLTMLPDPHDILKTHHSAFSVARRWACGAVGSALPWHGRGREFESHQVHQLLRLTFRRTRVSLPDHFLSDPGRPVTSRATHCLKPSGISISLSNIAFCCAVSRSASVNL